MMAMTICQLPNPDYIFLDCINNQHSHNTIYPRHIFCVNNPVNKRTILLLTHSALSGATCPRGPGIYPPPPASRPQLRSPHLGTSTSTSTSMLPLLLLAASAAASPASTRAASCKCGVQPSNRIVGGVEAKVNEFPWVAGLQIRMEGGEGDFMCGGTLVAAEWIVTAAHCLYKDQQFKQLQSAKDLIFGLGEHDQWAGGETKIPTIKVEGAKIIVNPAWDGLDTKGDIAMIKLAKPVDLTKYTPACLANTGQSFVGNTAWVYGEQKHCLLG